MKINQIYQLNKKLIIYFLDKIQSSSLIDLSDSHTLYMLIESIYKELATPVNTCVSHEKATMMNVVPDRRSNSRADGDHSRQEEGGQTTEKTNKKESGDSQQQHVKDLESLRNLAASHHLMLDELKSRKITSNNWNQKITIELVECKIKLKQLIMEM